MARRTQKKPEVPGVAPSAPAADVATDSTVTSHHAVAAASASEVGGGDPAPAAAPAAAPAPPAAPSPTTGANAQTIAADKAKEEELQRQVAATQHLVGSNEAVDLSYLTAPARLMAVVGVNAPDKDPEAHLPRPDQVDWEKVPANETRILTKQGWLLRP